MPANDIIKKIKASLEKELHIDLVRNPLHIRLENGAVLMEGTVEKIAHKKRALLIAMGMPGISGVIDRLKVKPATVMGDKEIQNHIYDAINSEPALNAEAGNIEIEVQDKIVDIEGSVHSLMHKRLAGLFAWWVPGSVDVINSLEVVPAEEDSDDEIKEAIRFALQRDKLVHDGNIGVVVRNYVITLEGQVHSETEKNAAEDDAWYIWGVNDVVNRLSVVK